VVDIVIQAGHYPRTVGATGTGGLDGDPTEQDFSIAAAHACAKYLQDAGHHGIVVWADIAPNQYRGDAFVAIHCDGSTSPAARGASAGYRTDEGQLFAETWKREYAARGWVGFRPDNYTPALAGYYGVRGAVAVGNRTAFIAEAGFLTNPEDEARLSPPGGPDRFARALTAAVVELFGGQDHEEDDLPYTEEQLRGIVRSVLDEGTAQGFQGWANTNRGLVDLGRNNFNKISAVQAAVSDLDDNLVEDIVTGIIAELPDGTLDAAALERVVRRVFADAGSDTDGD
jgi:hypothetical protein